MTTKGLLSIGAALALAAAVQVHAQDKSATHPVTITGCLQRADKAHPSGTSGAAGAPGITGTSGTNDAFILLDAHMGTGMTGGSSAANGHSAATPSSGGTVSGATPNATGNAPTQDSRQRTNVVHGPWYSVVGNMSDLRSRMNHRVEITGTLDTAGSVIGTSASVTEGSSGTIHAEQITVINASCNQ